MKSILLIILLSAGLHSGSFAQQAEQPLVIGRIDKSEINESVEGAGCVYYRTGEPAGKFIFITLDKTYIKVNGKLMILKPLELNYSKSDAHHTLTDFENKDVKVRIFCRFYKTGKEEGTMTVTDLKTGHKIIIKIEGQCAS